MYLANGVICLVVLGWGGWCHPCTPLSSASWVTPSFLPFLLPPFKPSIYGRVAVFYDNYSPLPFSLSLFSCCCQSGIYSRFPQWKCRQTNLGDACHPCLSSDLRLKLKKVKMTLMLLFQSRMRIGRRRRRRRFHYIGADAIQEVRQWTNAPCCHGLKHACLSDFWPNPWPNPKCINRNPDCRNCS